MGGLRDFFWSKTVHVFYGCRIADMPSIPTDASIRPATPADEEAVVAAFPKVLFARRFSEGDAAFLAFVAGRLVHQTWLSTRHAFIPQVEFDRLLAPDEIYFYDCVTLPEWRGRGLYPATLAHAARALQPSGRTRAVLGVLSTNEPSVHGVEKAGFRAEFEHRYYQCLGVSWARQVRVGAGAAR
ncbi:MAG: hypothetical protein HYY18_04370 [Planctomycetes bacterium]|nr:hypothetical protein [Planctomycetota bacterium]